MTGENRALREFLTTDHISYQLDGLEYANPEEIKRVVRSLTDQGVGVVAPLREIWCNGQVRPYELSGEKLGALGVGIGSFLLAARLLSSRVGLSDIIAAFIILAVGSCILFLGLREQRKSIREARYLQKRAHWASVVISSIWDASCTLPMLENCYGHKGAHSHARVLVEPIADRLAHMLPFVDANQFHYLSEQARDNIHFLLTKECQRDPSSHLVKEIINVVGRAGLIEFAGDINRLISMRFAPDLLAPAKACLAVLHELIEKRRHNDMLLRPSGFAGEEFEFLLKPADANSFDQDERLLRPAKDDQ